MNTIEKIEKILCNDPCVLVKELNLSYVKRLFPEFNKYIVIYKKERIWHCQKVVNTDSYVQDLDITGSPLEYSFDNDNFEDTTMILEKYWHEEEVSYFPFSRVEACKILNTCLNHLCNNYSVPIFILCDSKDKNKSTMLGTIGEIEWFTTIEVKIKSKQTLSVIKDNCSKLLQDHIKQSSVQPCEVSVSSLSTYHLFGKPYETDSLNFQGSLTLEIYGNSLLYYPPTRSLKSNLVIEIFVGYNNNTLTRLWQQLQLMYQYLTIIEEYENKKLKSTYEFAALKFPSDFINPLAKSQETIMENFNLLLKNDLSYRKSMYPDLQETYIACNENAAKLKEYIANAFFRLNLDFTDFVYELLVCSTNHLEIINYIDQIFQAVLTGEYQPQLNVTNSTRFAAIISNLSQQKTFSHLLVGSTPLQIMCDIGLEKLSRDYMHILMSTGFAEFYEIKQRLGSTSKEFNLKSYTNKLITMMQIHICLEFMLFLQTRTNCSTEVLCSMFDYSFKKYVSEEPVRMNLEELRENKMYSLVVPASNMLIGELDKGIPATWRITLTSEKLLTRLTTITYYSKMSIFPPTMCSTDNTHEENQTFHVVSATISSIKIK